MHKLAIAAALLAALTLGACGGSDLSTEDAHDTRNRCHFHPGGASEQNCLDDSQKRVIAFPNHFKNWSTACDGYGHRIFQNTSNQTFIYPDPTCPGYKAEGQPTVVISAGG